MSEPAALTFDDGPDPTWTPRVLDALRARGARATFFPIAERAQRHPELVGRMLEDGHAVEFHCARHLRHDRSSAEEVAMDLADGLRTLGSLGVRPRFWRPPWGVATERTHALAGEFGLTLVGWTADTHDWRGDAADGMLGEISPLLGPEAVVLMHDGLGPGALRADCSETVGLVEGLIPHLRTLGCEPLPLDALANVPPPRGTVVPK